MYIPRQLKYIKIINANCKIRQETMNIRKSAVAGQFYPANKDKLLAFVKESIEAAKIEGDFSNAVAYVAPHAGYIYSGYVAGHTYKALMHNSNIDNITAIVIGPNHTGIGTAVSISEKDWETPLGIVKVDMELAKEIVKNSDVAVFDESAHTFEHSVEVQLPFLQYASKNARFVPICMGDQSTEVSEGLADSIKEAQEALGRNIAIIASSDFNHYEKAEVGSEKDFKLIERLKTLDYKGFNSEIITLESSACGYGPITTAVKYAKYKGAKKGVLLDYGNSGKATGNYDEVVDYVAMAFV